VITAGGIRRGESPFPIRLPPRIIRLLLPIDAVVLLRGRKSQEFLMAIIEAGERVCMGTRGVEAWNGVDRP